MSKKNKKRPSSDMQKITLELDYDKLAKAIVKATKEADKIRQSSDTTPQENSKKDTPTQIIWNIITNKKKSQSAYTASAMAYILCVAFNLLAALSVLMSGTFLFFFFVYLISGELSLEKGAMAVVYIILSPVVALVFRACANEMEYEKDKNYIVGVFSGIVGLLAFTVPFILAH